MNPQRQAKDLQPFWNELVLADSTVHGDPAKRLWDQLVGKLTMIRTVVGAGDVAWSAALQPWTVFDRMEPFPIGFWSYEVLRGEKSAIESYPRKSRSLEATMKWAEERAKKDLRLDTGYRNWRRVTGWFRAPKKT